MKNVLSIIFIVLIFSGLAGAREMKLVWKDKTVKDHDIRIFTIYLGEHSRSYSYEHNFPGATLAINIAALPLKTDSANFIAATKNNIPVFSTELVILWIGDSSDTDNDGLIDKFEKKLGTKPNKKDSDEDGIPDGEEFATWGPKKWKLDFDEDGTINLLDPDSDGDGVLDGQDSDIRRIPIPFICSKKLLERDITTFIDLARVTKTHNKTPSEKGTVRFDWSPSPERGVRYRIYSTTETLPASRQKERKSHEKENIGAYDYSDWAVETKKTFTKIENLKPGMTYYFVMRVLNPAGEISLPSPESIITISH